MSFIVRCTVSGNQRYQMLKKEIALSLRGGSFQLFLHPVEDHGYLIKKLGFIRGGLRTSTSERGL